MGRAGLVQTINLCALEQALIKGVMSNILVLLIPSLLTAGRLWDGLQLRRRF